MKKILVLFSTLFFTNGLFGASISREHDIRIYTVRNADGKITGQTIEKAFEDTGFVIDGNNDMNKPFGKRFGKTFYPVYRLATVHDTELSVRLVRANPRFALLTPLSLSIWQDRDGNMNVSSLTLRGMARMTGIPPTNGDLVALAKKMEKALKAALPGGHFKTLPYTKTAQPDEMLAVTMKAEVELDEESTLDDWKDDFESEFEGEMESIGFLFPGFIGLNDDLIDHGIETYDFFDTYSVCKLDVIFPVHQTHPEVGAFAPCTFYLYKRKGENTMHMGFPSVRNWITATDIEDKKSLDPLYEAERLFVETVKNITE